MDINIILRELHSLESDKNKIGMKRFAINTERALGISIKDLEPLAKKIKKNHNLAIELWNTEIHEARILAILIGEPEELTELQIDKWVADFDSWDLCDQACIKLFRKNSIAVNKIEEFIKSDEIFIRRAGFALIATLAVHLKNEPDIFFDKYLDYIIEYSNDERNFVKKAVNWALRQIGKRNMESNEKAVTVAQKIIEKYPNSKSAKWIAADAIKELNKKKELTYRNE